MKKKRICGFWRIPESLKRVLMLMKIIVFILMVSFSTISANTFAQTRLSLKLNDVRIVKVIEEISSKTEYEFLYNDDEIRTLGCVSIDVKNVNVKKILDICFKNKGIEYKIVDNVILISAVSGSGIQQQEKIIKGKIVDVKGQPLPGVSVVVKGTMIGVSSDVNGDFQISVTGEQKIILQFSFIGKKTLEKVVPLNNKPLRIVLQDEASEIDEVVITGYYKADKKTYTGAATSISKDEILSISKTDIFSVLKVLDPSFTIVENNEMGSDPNTMPSFTIRGSASLNNFKGDYMGDPNMPLFMVDGFESSPEKVFDLDPLRILSMTVLKDASATAIYGSKAANGVVVIELDKPEKGKLRFNYNSMVNITAPDLSSYDLMNAKEKFDFEALTGTIKPLTPLYNERLSNVLKGYDTYWLEKPLQVAFDMNHRIGVSGGDDNLTYSATANFSPNSGIMKGAGRNRFGLTSNLTYRKGKINVSNTMSFNRVKHKDSPYGQFSQYGLLNPYYRFKDDDGEYLYELEKGVPNPLWNIGLDTKDEGVYNEFTNNFRLRWMINNNFIINGDASVTHKMSTDELFYPGSHNIFKDQLDLTKRGSYSKSSIESTTLIGRVNLSYSKNWNRHNITLNAGWNVSNIESSSSSFSLMGFVSEKLNSPSFAIEYDKYRKATGSSYVSRSMGLFLNTNYAFDNRYFVDFSFRSDISSLFGKDSRWASFWSVGAGYNLGYEEFMKEIEFINSLKIRASYGITGSQNFDPFQAMDKYSYIGDSFYNEYSIGAFLVGLGNEDLKWQRNISTNIGVDMQLFNNRLSVVLNRYKQTSEDLIIPVTLAPSLGFNTFMQNLGEAENIGYDISLRGKVIKTNDFSLSMSVNAAHNENKLVKISNALTAWNKEQDEESAGVGFIGSEKISKPKVRYIEGQSMSTIWVVPSLGIDPATGKEMYMNRNGEVTYVWNPDDIVPYATADPDLSGSIGLNIFCKGFSLNAYASYSVGGKIYNSTLVSRVENADYTMNLDRRAFDARWQKPGDQTFYKSIYDLSPTRVSSRFIQDNNYLNLTSLGLSYRFSADALKKTKYFKSVLLSLNTSDLFYLSTSKRERGLSYPFARKVNISLNISF